MSCSSSSSSSKANYDDAVTGSNDGITEKATSITTTNKVEDESNLKQILSSSSSSSTVGAGTSTSIRNNNNNIGQVSLLSAQLASNLTLDDDQPQSDSFNRKLLEQKMNGLFRTLEPFVHKLDEHVIAVRTSQELLNQELNLLLQSLHQIKLQQSIPSASQSF